jgi:hypothetical protein
MLSLPANAGIRNVQERLIELTSRGPIGAKFTLKREFLHGWKVVLFAPYFAIVLGGHLNNSKCPSAAATISSAQLLDSFRSAYKPEHSGDRGAFPRTA